MRKSTLWTILGVVVAVIIAWVLVNVLFSLIAFVFRLVAVAVVAVIVFLVLRAVFARREVDRRRGPDEVCARAARSTDDVAGRTKSARREVD